MPTRAREAGVQHSRELSGGSNLGIRGSLDPRSGLYVPSTHLPQCTSLGAPRTCLSPPRPGTPLLGIGWARLGEPLSYSDAQDHPESWLGGTRATLGQTGVLPEGVGVLLCSGGNG